MMLASLTAFTRKRRRRKLKVKKRNREKVDLILKKYQTTATTQLQQLKPQHHPHPLKTQQPPQLLNQNPQQKKQPRLNPTVTHTKRKRKQKRVRRKYQLRAKKSSP